MAGSITHAKSVNTTKNPDLTQAQLDALIASGQYAAGTLLADIWLNSDVASGHVFSLDKTDVGLSNVDNTSDANKPVSTATQTALNLKADTSSLATIATTGSASNLSAGTVPAARMPALTGDVTTVAGAVATTLATVNSNVGSFTNANITVNAKGLVTAASNGSAASPTVVSVTPSGTQNDYSPGSFTTLRVGGTGAPIITGLLAGTAGGQITIRNIATVGNPVVMCDENAGSTAANRFTLTTGINRGHLVLWPGDSCVIEYDGTTSRWVLVSVSAAREAWVRRSIVALAGNATPSTVGLTTAGANSAAATMATGSYLATVPRVSYSTSTTINTLASNRGGQVQAMVGDAAGRGGFLFRHRFGFTTVPSTAATFFAGLRTTVAFVATSSFSSQVGSNPAIGFGIDNTQSTLRFWKNGTGSAIDTTNDLGANFPFSAGACYDSMIFMPSNGGSAGWVIWRTDDVTIAPKAGYETATIPVTTDTLSYNHSIANLAAANYVSALMDMQLFTPN